MNLMTMAGWRRVAALGLVLLGSVAAQAASIPGVWYGAVAWGDYDNDGRPDLALTGATNQSPADGITELWRNTGADFAKVSTTLPALSHSAAAWADYNGDGRLDLLLNGWTRDGARVTQLWRNTGSGFVNSGIALPGTFWGALAWGDYDNDGRPDILLTGWDTNSVRVSQIWRNTGTAFTNINAGLPGVDSSAVAWGDYDNDGRLDLILTGTTSSGEICQIWRNTGSGFVNANIALPGLSLGSVAWGDYNNDGRLDLLLAGNAALERVTQVWRNTGSGFVNSGAVLPGVQYAAVAWNDHDNDGRLDLLVTGDGASGRLAQVWRNTGSGFVNANLPLEPIYWGAVGWADANGDGWNDLALTGDAAGGRVFQLWQNTPPQAAPTVTTLAASGITTNGATLNGTVNPNGAATSYYFEHGATTSYGSRTATNSVGAGTSAVAVNASLSGLPSSTTRHYRLVAVNSGGTTLGGNQSFSTTAIQPAPTVTTLAASGITTNGAVLNGTVNPNGAATSYYFEYGATTSYGSQTATTSAGSGTSAVSANASLSGLPASTTRHYRLVAVNSGGTSLGGNQSFNTAAMPLAPTASTLAATGVTTNGALLNGTVNPNGAATSYYFEYGATTSYGSQTATTSAGSGTSAVSVNASLSGLPASTTRHYRLVAVNSGGTTLGGNQSFNTAAIQLPPAVVTLAASGITTNGAVLNGTVNPNGAATSYYFEYAAVTAGDTGAVETAEFDKTGLLAWWAARGASNAVEGQLIDDNTDLTGNGFAATSSGNARPTYRTNAVNGQPAWQFDGGDFWNVAGLNQQIGDFTLFVTARDNGSPANSRLFDKDRSSGFWAARQGDGTVGGGASRPNSPYGIWAAAPETFTLMLRKQGSNTVVWVNGTNWVQDTTAPVISDTKAAAIGRASGQNFGYFRGWIAEIALFTNAVPLATCTNTMSFFTATYGIGSMPPPPAQWTSTSTNALPGGSVPVSVSAEPTGLAPGTDHVFRLVATSAAGTVSGDEKAFTTALPSAQPAPTVATLAASGITTNGATLNGTVNPNGAATSYYFEHGATTSYGSRTATNSVGAGTSAVAVNATLSGLPASTTRHYRLVAVNSGGTTLGGNQSFTTTAIQPAPTVTTLAASGITTNGAVLNGTVNPNGAATSYYFEYGATTSYGSQTATTSAGSGTSAVSVNASLSGLPASTTRHYRLVAVNSGGTSLGGNQSFNTAAMPLAPTASTLAATGVTTNGALLNGTVNPNGAATSYYFEYGATTSYGSQTATTSAGSGTSAVSANASLSGLPASTTRHYRLVAVNSGGTSLGGNQSFNTAAMPLAPTASTLAATGVTTNGALLNGTVNPNGAATSYHFEYAPIPAEPTEQPTGFTGEGLIAWWAARHMTNAAEGQLIDSNGDLTGNGYTATASGNARPAFRQNVLNGQPAWQFDGGDFWNVPALTNRIGDFTVFVTARANGAPDHARLFDKDRFDGFWAARRNNGTAGGGANRSPSPYGIWAPAPDTFTLMVRKQGAHTVVWVNGESWVEDFTAPQVSDTSPGTIGKASGQSYGFFKGWIAEIALFTNAVPLEACTNTMAFFNATYGTGPRLQGPPPEQWLSTATNSLPAGNQPVNVSAGLSGLASDTEYVFRLVADNAIGAATGSNQVFATTASQSAPAVATLAATGITTNGAVLNGTVNPNGAATSYYFEHGATTSYGSRTATNSVGAGSAEIAVSAAVSGLQPGTTYHYRLVAVNSGGTALGQDRSVATQSFLWVPPIPDLVNGVPAWGDHDNDGLVDLLLVGRDSAMPSRLWRNTGSTFTGVAIPGLPGLAQATAAWGDYDNDGLLDFAVSGDTGEGFVTQLWRNTGEGFAQMEVPFPGSARGSLAWGDHDNDGRIDLLITGESDRDGGVILAELWRNTPDGFERVEAGLPPVRAGQAAWGDYDNDGWADLLLTGSTNWSDAGAITAVFRNTGEGFERIEHSIPAVARSSAAWQDHDGDGLLDLALSGLHPEMDGILLCQVWRNTGNGFELAEAALPGFVDGSLTWGDYDNDGRPDLFLAGDGQGEEVAGLFRNTPEGFVVVATDLDAVGSSLGSWADIDTDGRLDLLLTGTSSEGVFAAIRKNLSPEANRLPQPPAMLEAIPTTGGVVLLWTGGSDPETPASGLSYSLRIGTAPGGSDIVAAAAGPDGTRRLQGLGNRQLATNAVLALPPGTYYWSVQSVDGGYAGSEFAPERSFTIAAVPVVVPVLTGIQRLGDGTMRVTFTAAAGADLRVVAGSDLSSPMSAWSTLGSASETSPGVFEFIDTAAGSATLRFYGAKAE